MSYNGDKNWFEEGKLREYNIWRAGKVDQVVECLPSKCEALSSNPNAAKKLV
jgi:hypothetical protein